MGQYVCVSWWKICWKTKRFLELFIFFIHITLLLLNIPVTESTPSCISSKLVFFHAAAHTYTQYPSQKHLRSYRWRHDALYVIAVTPTGSSCQVCGCTTKMWMRWKLKCVNLENPGNLRWADMKTVFVTVGTTSFDELIESITSSEATQVRKVTWGVIEDVNSVQWNHWNQQGIGRRAFKIYELPITFMQEYFYLWPI